ncbi:Mobile element protein [Brachybacterium faecium]|nr:Mobile element protein [Brachybacterium faecium]
MFSAQTNLVKEHCFISKNVIQSILVEEQSILSEKDIAKHFRVSTTTVSRALHQWQEHFRPSYQSLPQHLSMDEFKSVKSADNQMSFIFSVSTTHKIIDILPSRRLTVLKDYFSSYSRTVRNAVKTVVVDMNAPYYVLVKELFPKAKLIVDRFHLSQLIVRSMSQTRIQLMNRFKTSCPESQKTYRKLKRYWKLILKKESELSDTAYRYTPLFKCIMISYGIIDYLTNLDESFKATYRLVQQLTVAFDHRNFEAYNALIHQKHSEVSHYLKKAYERYVNIHMQSIIVLYIVIQTDTKDEKYSLSDETSVL